ncbi:L-lysine 6-monooxygenase (NADPH-requiring)-domain-containing protein [Bisporella sp. PMI_857]|nr:L-lysine 6-monooxygenase (NADPH-requiring)-domain-containing protein [Bisporella sp. PMI_857]
MNQSEIEQRESSHEFVNTRSRTLESSIEPIQDVRSAYSPSPSHEVQDLICIGFGPASLAIAIALQESSLRHKPKVSFLERQPQFAWHSGMQLPGARMQISFLKDLATPRNPQSKFTFLSYLFAKNRLNTFINLDTFLPSRKEYEDYLRWIAGHFEAQGLVSYGQEVLEVAPAEKAPNGKVSQFRITSRDIATQEVITRLARHVVIAVGGKPMLPPQFPSHSSIIHSSQYSNRVSSTLPSPSAPYNIAVIGSGQSAAEIFNDLPSRYPNAKVTMVIKSSALRPSDDSPFVNEIFDPDRVDGVYSQPEEVRARAIAADRATNYSVVRLNLIEHLYEKLYAQRLDNPDSTTHKLAIRPNRQVVRAQTGVGNGRQILLSIENAVKDSNVLVKEEMLVDAVFVATGYIRNAHEDILEKSRSLLREGQEKFPVRRSYKVDFDPKKVEEGAGVWLQGCNEKTHGLSDTLLSILAIRGGELVNSIFGEEQEVLQLKSKL